MIDLIEKDKRFVAEKGEEYVVVPKRALETLMEDHSELCVGFERDEETWASYDEIHEAQRLLSNSENLTIDSFQIQEMQETLFYLSLDDIRMYLEGHLTSDELSEEEYEELVEAIGKEAKAERIESEDELKEIVSRHA